MDINVSLTIKADSSAIAFATALGGGKAVTSGAAPVKVLTPKPDAGSGSEKTDTTGTGTVVTLELLRAFLSENPKKRAAIKSVIVAAGAASVSTLDETKYEEVYEAFKAL